MKVLVNCQFPPEPQEILRALAQINVIRTLEAADKDVVYENLKTSDAFVCLNGVPLPGDVLSRSANLKMIANAFVGYDHVDIEAASKLGILVTNAPGVLDNAVADLTFALLIGAARRIAEADRFARSGNWRGFKADLLLGLDLYGKTIGIVGFGRIGQAVARRANGFGMRVIYTKGSPTPSPLDKEIGSQQVDLGTLLKEADFIALNCPLTEKTFHLIGESELKQMKPSCLLVNTARGAIVDQMALLKALQAKQIWGAALDVFENEPEIPAELRALDNVLLAPHIGSATESTRRAMAKLAAESVKLAFSGTLPKNTVNPDAWEKFLDRQKLTVDV